MKKSMALKTLLRSPLKTLLTFLLIVSATFALFSRVTAYIITVQETKNAESLYHAVASLDNEVPDFHAQIADISSRDGTTGRYYEDVYEVPDKPWPSEEKLEEFASLPGVALADTRYMTAGLVEDYKRLVKYDHQYRVIPIVFEGTYAGYEDDALDSVVEGHVNVKFDDVRVVACEVEADIESSLMLKSIPLGDTYYAKSPFTKDFFGSIKVGSRCLVYGDYGRWDHDAPIAFDYKMGKEALSVVEGLPENYLEMDSFARQKGWVDAIEQGRYVYDMVYTSDMRAIPGVNEQRIVIVKGRCLTAEDTDVCVVNEDFLEEYQLSVGDTISVKLGDRIFDKHEDYTSSAKASEGEEMPGFGETVELTIVGTYQMEHGGYTQNTIFVPSTLLPVDVPENFQVVPGEFSVFVEDAGEIESFFEAAEPFAEELGLKLEFSDRGWLDVKDSLGVGALTSLLTTILYIVGAALALFLAIYLHMGRNKKTYAIMRTMGVPERAAGQSTVFPFAAISVPAVLAGGIAGLFFARDAAARTLADMAGSAPLGYAPETGIPAYAVALCLLAELMFVSLSCFIFSRKMKKTPPLELLQGDIVRVGAKALQDVALQGTAPIKFDISRISDDRGKLTHKKYGAIRHVSAYVVRHMRRGIGKTAVSLALAAVLASGIGMFVLARLNYQDAYYALGVKGEAEEFAFSSVSSLSNSSLVKDFYCWDNFEVRVKGSERSIFMTITNDIEQYLGDGFTVDYVDGYDISSFEGTGPLCLVGKGLADELGIVPGDQVGMISGFLYHTLASGEGNMEDIYKQYKVIGVVDSADETTNQAFFTGIRGSVIEWLFGFGMDVPMEHCEFTLADNDRVADVDALLEKEAKRNETYAPGASYHIDSGGLANIARIRNLLESLFPIAMVAAVLIGLAGPLLIILQSAQEAAFLRILGVTKKRARCMLVFEQMALCIAGIILVAGGILLSRPGLFARSIQTLAVCLGLYFLGCVCGATVAAVQVTRHRVLELLQVRE